MLKFLKRISHLKEAKTLAQNFTYLSLFQLAMYIFPLITAPYLARTIGAKGYGILAIGSTLMAYFALIIEFGFSYTAVRDIAKIRDNKGEVSKIVFTVIFTEILLSIIATLIFIACILFIPIYKEYKLILSIFFLGTIINVFYAQWFFQAIEKMKYITLFNLTSRLIFVIAIFFVVKEENDYIYCPILTLIGNFIASIGSFIIMIKKFDVKFYRPNFKEIKIQINRSKDIFINLLFPNLYNNLSALLLSFYGTPTQLGLYDGGRKFMPIGENLQKILSQTFFPYLSRNIHAHKYYKRLVLSLSIVITAIMFFSSDFLTTFLLGVEFKDSALILKIYCFSIFFFALIDIYGTNYLILVSKERLQRNITITCSIVGFFLTIILVPMYNIIGAAISVTLTRGLMGIGTYLYARKIQLKTID